MGKENVRYGKISNLVNTRAAKLPRTMPCKLSCQDRSTKQCNSYALLLYIQNALLHRIEVIANCDTEKDQSFLVELQLRRIDGIMLDLSKRLNIGSLNGGSSYRRHDKSNEVVRKQLGSLFIPI